MSLSALFQWLDSDCSDRTLSPLRSFTGEPEPGSPEKPRVEPDRILPFAFLHAACLALPLVGFSWAALFTAIGLYVVRMFAITAFYHRYFSHRAFKTGRVVQFVFAVLGCSAVQRGPLWWAAHHRHHHRHADDELDIHSPRRSFLWSHIGWLTSSQNMLTRYERVQDFARYPELVFLNRFDWLVPVLLAVILLASGELLRLNAPQLHTNGPQLLVWGFFLSTVILFHATCSINSLAHVFGTRRYDTQDDSRNNFWLAVLTMGEGWHNNHHRFSSSCRQGFYWWEIDLSYYVLLLMEKTGLVGDLKPVPELAYKIASDGSEAEFQQGQVCEAVIPGACKTDD